MQEVKTWTIVDGSLQIYLSKLIKEGYSIDAMTLSDFSMSTSSGDLFSPEVVIVVHKVQPAIHAGRDFLIIEDVDQFIKENDISSELFAKWLDGQNKS